MKLTELFDIIYCDSNIKEKYSNFIETFDCNNLLNTHKNISSQFVLIISNNIVMNKTYNKLKLEFHNIDKNNINNDLILNTLNKLQTIINNSLSDDENEILIEGLDSYTEEDYDSHDDEDDTWNASVDTLAKDNDNTEDNDNNSLEVEDDIVLPEKVEDDIKTILKKTEYLQIHILQKQYENDKKLKYLATFLLNNTLKIPKELDITNETFGKYDDGVNIDSLFSLSDYYNNTHKNYNDYNSIYDYLENYDIIDNYLLNNLSKILSGFYLNHNDIRFQIILKLIILTNIGDHGNIIKKISHKQFSKNNSINNYFIHDELHTNFFEKLLINNIHIYCDVCNTSISSNSKTTYFHNDYGGDICEHCYSIKQDQFKSRINHIKNKFLLIGRIELFKKELQITKTFLKKRKFKIKKKNYYLLLEKMNKNLINEPTDEHICKICYSPLCNDIYVGSDCGHCFHKTCIEQCDKCQICRKETKFIKLFL